MAKSHKAQVKSYLRWCERPRSYQTWQSISSMVNIQEQAIACFNPTYSADRPSVFAQVSRSPTVRLKTNFSEVLSVSTLK